MLRRLERDGRDACLALSADQAAKDPATYTFYAFYASSRCPLLMIPLHFIPLSWYGIFIRTGVRNNGMVWYGMY